MAGAPSSSIPIKTLLESIPTFQRKNPLLSGALPVCNQQDSDTPISRLDTSISCEDSSIILAVPGHTKTEDHPVQSAEKQNWEPNVRPNSFVAMRIPSVEIREGLKGVQDALVRCNRDMKHVLTSLDKLHLTMLVLKLTDESEIERAISTLESATKKVVHDYHLSTYPLELTLKGVGTFGRNVLFAEIEDGPSKERLQEIAGVLKSMFVAAKFPGIDPKPFNPHLTIAKMSTMPQGIERRYKQRTGRRMGIERKGYVEFTETDFGHQVVDGLELLSMKLPADSQGYYHCFHRNHF